MPTFALRTSPGQARNWQRGTTTATARVRGLPAGAAELPRHRHWLSGEIAKLGPFRLLTDGYELPVFAFTLNDQRMWPLGVRRSPAGPAGERLAGAGLHVPGEPHRPAPRCAIVIRNGFSHDMADMLLADLASAAAPAEPPARTDPRRRVRRLLPQRRLTGGHIEHPQPARPPSRWAEPLCSIDQLVACDVGHDRLRIDHGGIGVSMTQRSFSRRNTSRASR